MRHRGSLDAINMAAYEKPSTVRWFGHRDGYYDAGERRVFMAITEEMAGKSILDVGVGAGRTVPLLRAISEDYVAVDYSEEMVRLCRRLHPGVDVQVGDARHLAFPAESRDLVVFSCAGIDHVAHQDRQTILREAHRVLKPGGLFVFSTHNKDGPGHGEKPWGSRRELARVKHMAGLALFFPLNMRNHLRNRTFDVDADGWSMRNSAFDHFSMVFHYTTLKNQLDDLLSAGFSHRPEAYESNSGREVDFDRATDAWLLHLIVRR